MVEGLRLGVGHASAVRPAPSTLGAVGDRGSRRESCWQLVPGSTVRREPVHRAGIVAPLRPGPLPALGVDLEAGTVQVIEVITEPKGQLHFGPPKTSAGRRMVGLPRFVVDALAERMAGPGAPEELVFAGPHGGALRVTLFRRRFWVPATRAAGLVGLRIHDLRHTAVARPAGTARWRADLRVRPVGVAELEPAASSL